MTEFKFPLNRLPADAHKNVLRTMDYGELIGFSLSSKSTKQKVVALNYTLRGFDLKCTDACVLRIWNVPATLFNKPFLKARFESSSVMKLLEPSTGTSTRYTLYREYKNEKFEANDWIAHLASIFHVKNISELDIYGGTLTIENIQSVIRSMEFRTLHLPGRDHETTQNLLKHFVPRNSIVITGTPLPPPSNLLIQNLNELTVFFCQYRKLNDFLMLNAKYAYLHRVTMTSKDWNRFLKLWMKGSNPHLIYLECEAYRADFNEDEVKKGINGVQIPNSTIRTFERYNFVSMLERFEVRGGFDIRRHDGTLATIFYETTYFNFLVWQ